MSTIAAGTTSTTALVSTGDTTGKLVLQTNGTTTAMTIDTSQNVGIGTSSPAVPLHVYKTSGRNDYRIASGSSSGEVASVQFYGTDSGAAAQNYAQIIGGVTTNTAGSEAGYLSFETVNSGSVSERMRIDSSGALVLNNSGGDAQFYIGGTSGTSRMYLARSSADSLLWNVDNGNMRFGTNNTERMRITSGGNLLLGTTSAVDGKINVYVDNSAIYSLDCNSSSNTGTQYYLQFKRQGTTAGYLTSNSSTTVQLNNASDVRLKENIQDAGSAIPSIMAAQVRQFDWKENRSQHQDFGFVAQELVEVIPEAVSVGVDNEDGTIKMPWGIDYSHIVPRLVKAVQELKAITDAQAARIETLEAKVAALEAK